MFVALASSTLYGCHSDLGTTAQEVATKDVATEYGTLVVKDTCEIAYSDKDVLLSDGDAKLEIMSLDGYEATNEEASIDDVLVEHIALTHEELSFLQALNESSDAVYVENMLRDDKEDGLIVTVVALKKSPVELSFDICEDVTFMLYGNNVIMATNDVASMREAISSFELSK